MLKIVCKLRGISKSFGTNDVLRGIDLDLNAGEIVVLMGANGAGKSTLVKLICGYHTLDSGTMELDGQPYSPEGPADAITAGVVTVHQSIDDGVIPDLDVATNPAVVGEVSVRSLALLLAGDNPGASVIVPPTLITQDFLNEMDIKNMDDLGANMPQFRHADVAMADWMPLPTR